MPQNLRELLLAIESGQDAFEAPDRSASEWPKFIQLFNCAVQAEHDGLIQGLEVRRSKGVQSYGWPVKFRVKQITPQGKKELEALGL
jgi:hypothetical protein